MRKSTKLALAFMAVAGVAGGSAFAEGGKGKHHGQRGDSMMRFERIDLDSSGDITFEEFAAAMQKRIGTADADKDGKITVAEIADEIQRMRAERMAEQIVKRFDADGDGTLTLVEIESRQKKMFALIDRNDDGKIEETEMSQRGRKGRHH